MVAVALPDRRFNCWDMLVTTTLIFGLLALSGGADSAADSDAILRRCLDAATNASTAGQVDCEAKAERRYDERMNAAYTALLHRLPAEAAARLRIAQRAWLTFRSADNAAGAALFASRSGTMYVPMQAATVTQTVHDRALQLEAYLRFIMIEE
jgi:uncharacterized protein YecT (DUF1311 family)